MNLSLALILILLYLLMLSLSFFFSGSETGFLSINKTQLQEDVLQRKPGSGMIQRLYTQVDSMLGTTLLGTNLANNALASLAFYIVVYILGFRDGWLLTLFGVIINPMFILIVGEVFPKLLYREKANGLLYFTSIYLRFFQWAFLPAVWFITRVSDGMLWSMRIRSHRSEISRQDIVSLIRQGQRDGIMDEREGRFAEAIVSLSTTKVVEMMRPVVNLYMLSSSQDVMGVIKDLRSQDLEIIPIYEERIDNIIGYIRLIDVLDSNKKKLPAEDILITTDYIPESVTLDRLYNHISQNKKDAFVVVDEYGGCSGIISKIDIVRRIFGLDFDNGGIDKGENFYKINRLEYEVVGGCDIDDLNARLKLRLPKNGFETLAGFIQHHIGHVPREGELFTFQGIQFRVLQSARTSVNRVHILLPGRKNRESIG